MASNISSEYSQSISNNKRETERNEEIIRRSLEATRMKKPQELWNLFANEIAKNRQALEEDLAVDPPIENLRHLLPNLREQSYLNLPYLLEGAADIRSYLLEQDVWLGPHKHSYLDRGPLSLEEASKESPIACYDGEKVLRAPGLIDQLNDPRTLDLIEQYLGCVPTLYGISAYWSFPSNCPDFSSPIKYPSLYSTQFWHRDTDDFRFVTLFIYLSDVDSNAGPHQLIPGSHSSEGMEKLTRSDALDSELAEEQLTFSKNSFGNITKGWAGGDAFAKETNKHLGHKAKSITGPLGSLFLVNTMAMHRGLRPTEKPRLAIWARFGMHPPSRLNPPVKLSLGEGLISNRDTPLSSDLNTRRHRYINRLMIEFENNGSKILNQPRVAGGPNS